MITSVEKIPCVSLRRSWISVICRKPVSGAFSRRTPAGRAKLLKAKIAVALHTELGRVPKKEEIERVFLLVRVMYKAVLALSETAAEERRPARDLLNPYVHRLRPRINRRPNP
jgi:hypothetical protein